MVDRQDIGPSHLVEGLRNVERANEKMPIGVSSKFEVERSTWVEGIGLATVDDPREPQQPTHARYVSVVTDNDHKPAAHGADRPCLRPS